jgi:hypothetical protein
MTLAQPVGSSGMDQRDGWAKLLDGHPLGRLKEASHGASPFCLFAKPTRAEPLMALSSGIQR